MTSPFFCKWKTSSTFWKMKDDLNLIFIKTAWIFFFNFNIFQNQHNIWLTITDNRHNYNYNNITKHVNHKPHCKLAQGFDQKTIRFYQGSFPINNYYCVNTINIYKFKRKYLQDRKDCNIVQWHTCQPWLATSSFFRRYIQCYNVHFNHVIFCIT